MAMLALAGALGAAMLAPATTLAAFTSGSFTTDVTVSQPTDLTPSSGTTLAYPTEPVRLEWGRVAGTGTYELQLAQATSSSADCTLTTAFASDAIVVNTRTSDTAWVPTMLDTQSARIWTGTYCWRVRSYTSTTKGMWSTGYKFTRTWNSTPTNLRFFNDESTIPRADETVATDTSTKVTGYLRWDPVPGATGYDLQVSPSRSFAASAIAMNLDDFKGNAVALLHLPDNTYFWRVRAVASNGTEGEWTSAATPSFTVSWVEPEWNDPANVTPAYASTESEIQLGWTPVRGASYYEVQAASSAGCFWETEIQALAYWGDWVDKPEPPKFDQCRLTEHHKTTLNNFITLPDVFSEKVFINISKGAGLPPVVYWRVRPVYQFSQETETGWEIGDGAGEVYGDWLEYDIPGFRLPYKFSLDPGTATTTTDGDRCESDRNPTAGNNQCLVQVGSYMQANSVVINDSTSMQLPVLRWNVFPGNFIPAYSGGYIVQIARDPNFTTTKIVKSVTVPALGGSYGYGWQHSWAPTDSLPDDSEDTGLWWRAVPCESDPPDEPDDPINPCLPLYYLASAGMFGAFPDTAGSMSYTKDSSFITDVSSEFSGSSPLLKWPAIDSADHYEIEIASDPYFVNDVSTLRTTVPRIVPYTATSTPGNNDEIADGTWYFRVRAVDANGINGGWSDTMYDPDFPGDPAQAIPAVFTKRTPAPTITTSDLTLVDPNPVVTWSTVAGADYYELQYSEDPNFETYNSVQTQQPAYLLSGSNATWFYRARASVDGNLGIWSAVDDSGPYAAVEMNSRIEYEVSRSNIPSGQGFIIDGMVYNKGVAYNTASVVLERKNTNCGVAGSYSDLSMATSGETGEEGLVRFSLTADRNRCYRMKWDNGVTQVYSAPIQVTVMPVVTLSYSTTSAARNSYFSVTMRSNRALTGRMRLQYRYNNVWFTIKTVTLSSQTSRKVNASINRAGKFYTRVVLDRLYLPANGGDISHPDYVDTYVYGPRMTITDLWSFYY